MVIDNIYINTKQLLSASLLNDANNWYLSLTYIGPYKQNISVANEQIGRNYLELIETENG